MSSKIIKEQSFERSEDYGSCIINQKCIYNSVSQHISIETDGQTLLLPVDEWKLLYDLIKYRFKIKRTKIINKL